MFCQFVSIQKPLIFLTKDLGFMMNFIWSYFKKTINMKFRRRKNVKKNDVIGLEEE